MDGLYSAKKTVSTTSSNTKEANSREISTSMTSNVALCLDRTISMADSTRFINALLRTKPNFRNLSITNSSIIY